MKTWLAALMLSLAAGLASADDGSYSFGAFGDTPYSDAERVRLPGLIADMDAEPLVFVMHDGDIKNGGSRCDDATFEDILGVFRRSRHPFVYVPGDNEWTDCHRWSNGGYDPLERLDKLRAMFFPGPDFTLGQARMAGVESQSADPEFAAYRENLRWQHGPVQFLTLNLPGSDNNFGNGREPSAEFIARGKANAAWVAQGFARARADKLSGVVIMIQADPGLEDYSIGRPAHGYRVFLDQLLRETRNFAGEVLLIHGDTHVYRLDHPLHDPASVAAVANFTRLETFGSPFIGWVKVSVHPGRTPLFGFDPHPYSPHYEKH
ncbi:MAG: hypothetical protein HGA47_05835 [Zoogloea sp.]|nr:hypothetical protein [Zoogloea sp.]